MIMNYFLRPIIFNLCLNSFSFLLNLPPSSLVLSACIGADTYFPTTGIIEIPCSTISVRPEKGSASFSRCHSILSLSSCSFCSLSFV